MLIGADAQSEDNGRKIETKVRTWEENPGTLITYGRMEKIAVMSLASRPISSK